MTALGQVLAVFTDTAVCDRCGAEHAIVSDGQRAYAYPLDPHARVAGDTGVSRTGVTLTATCLLPSGLRFLGEDADPCGGDLVFRLDTDGSWTSDADARRLLTAYGRGVDQ